MRRFLTMFMILGLVVGSVSTAAAEDGFEPTERTIEVSYYGSRLVYESCPLSIGAGCVALPTLAGEQSLTAEVTDAHGQPVSVSVVGASESLTSDRPRALYGTFCGRTTKPIRFEPGAQLELWVGMIDWFPTWWIVPEVPEELRCFPGQATAGTITVTLAGWARSEEAAAASPEPSESPTPAAGPTPSPSAEPLERSIDLELQRHLRAVGSVVAADPSCGSGVPVVIQRKTVEGWFDIASTTADAEGAFATRLTDRPGRYRAVTPEVGTDETSCQAARSATRRHHH